MAKRRMWQYWGSSEERIVWHKKLKGFTWNRETDICKMREIEGSDGKGVKKMKYREDGNNILKSIYVKR